MNEPRYVSYDRWDGEHQALVQRIVNLETQAHELAGAEAEHRALDERISELEQTAKDEQRSSATRRDRIWVLALTLVSGVIFPIVVTAVITFLHLKSVH